MPVSVKASVPVSQPVEQPTTNHETLKDFFKKEWHDYQKALIDLALAASGDGYASSVDFFGPEEVVVRIRKR